MELCKYGQRTTSPIFVSEKAATSWEVSCWKQSRESPCRGQTVESEEELDVSHKCLVELLGMEEYKRHFDDCFADNVAETIEAKIWKYRYKYAHFVFMAT